MAVSSRTARNIVVNGTHYRWRAAGYDGGIGLTVWPHELPGPKIVCTFDYDQTKVPCGDGSYSLTKQLVITNRLVRRILLRAIRTGYDPRVKGRQLNVGRADKLIDITDAVRGR